MPDHHLLWLVHAGPEIAWLGRSLRRIVHPVITPALALAIGAALPLAAHLAMAVLPAVAVLLIFSAIAAAPPGRTSRAEALRAAAILHVCMLACPAAIAAAMIAIGSAPALTCAAVLVAGSPVSMGCGLVSERLGMPGRPAVWAAVMGVAIVPFNLPLIAAATGAPGLPAPGALAAAALAIAGLPLSAALAARRLAPRALDGQRRLLRLVLIVCLATLACLAGGRTMAALARPDGWTDCAVALGVQASSALVAWGIGRGLASLRRAGSLPALPPQLALASTMRNTSVVWAACLAAGGISPRTEGVVGAFVSLTVLAPVAAALGAALRRRYSASAPEMISISSRVMLAWRVRL